MPRSQDPLIRQGGYSTYPRTTVNSHFPQDSVARECGFVEKQRFAGTCYKAANWICVGETQGRGKLDTSHARALPLKTVWVYPLSPYFHKLLAR